MCRLKRSFYGLKQAHRARFDRLSQFLIANGFICSKVDPSLFVFKNEFIIAYTLIYVDDIMLTETNPIFLSQLVIQLSTEFSLKNLEALHFS